MEVVSARSALLSNYEVLTLLKELESDQLARTKTALRIKKEEEQSIDPNVKAHYRQVPEEIVSENLRTVEFEAIQYLTSDYQPLLLQNEALITQLVKDLAPYELTKGEKLQIVNLAPTKDVELYVIVEELEDRLGEDKMREVLDIVRKSLSARQSTMETGTAGAGPISFATAALTTTPGSNAQVIEEAAWDEDAHYDEYIDTGEGAGVEGDLEMDED